MLSVIGVTIERFVYFEHQFTNLSQFTNMSESNETPLYIAAPCNSWLCEADVTFAAVLLVNLGKPDFTMGFDFALQVAAGRCSISVNS